MNDTWIDSDESARSALSRLWTVILYNDDVHDFEEVVGAVREATAKPEAEAYRITLEAHSKGRSRAFSGLLADCQRVARVLRGYRLQVDVDEA